MTGNWINIGSGILRVWCLTAPSHYPNQNWHFDLRLQLHASPEGQWIKGMWWLVDYNVLQRYILMLLIVVGWHICDIYMCQWTGSSLVHVIACRMLGAKSLPEPILQLDPQKVFSEKSNWNTTIFIQENVFENVGFFLFRPQHVKSTLFQVIAFCYQAKVLTCTSSQSYIVS